MKVLITGAYGQLGRELIRVIEGGKSPIDHIPLLYKGCEIIPTDIDALDISNRKIVEDYFCDIRPDIIFNCAAKTNVDACESEPDNAFMINALGARNLAMAANAIKAAMVHVSTDYVFSGDGNNPLCEWDTPTPKTIYGKSKLLGEQYVARFCPKSFIVRTAWLYGHDGQNFVKTIIRNAKEKGVLNVVSDQFGCPTYTGDLAHHLLELAVTKEYGLYHCVGAGECSWFDFAQRIVELSGIQCETLPCTTEEYPRPAPRPAYSVLQNMMLKCTIGDRMRPWQEALESFFNLNEVNV